MAYEVINVKAATWTQIGNGNSIDFQLLGDREAYWKYADEQPTGRPPNDEPANYVLNSQIYNSSREFGSVWVYSIKATNFAVNQKTIYNTRNFSKYSPKSLIPLNQKITEKAVAVQTVKNDYFITLNNVTDISIGDYLIMFNADIDNAFYGFVQAIVGNTIEVNVPINDNFPIGSQVDIATIFLNVAGSKVSQEIFLRRGGSAGNLGDDLIGSRFMIQCITEGQINFQNFGDIVGGLANGLVFRERDENGKERHLFTVQTNGDLSEIAYDFRPFEASNPAQGVNGFVARLSFGGTSKIGSTIRMSSDGDIVATVQDDLSSLVSLTVTPEGYFLRG
jgi:hypothetical protein